MLGTTLKRTNGQPKPPANMEADALDAEQIRRIERALQEIGDFGEVRLIKANGRLRFIQKVSSEDLGRDHP